MDWTIKKATKGLEGEVTVPSDKSISHRAVMFGAIANGKCSVDNFLLSEDCLRTVEAFRAMGISIEQDGRTLIIRGKGLKGLMRPEKDLYLGNSGTTMRIISGILAGQDFSTKLTGDESLSKRPMRRVTEPLKSMGADIDISDEGTPPIFISPAGDILNPIDYISPVASAQVKSCILSAGLFAGGTTSVTEPHQSRDHTERMLEYFSADMNREGLTTSIRGLKSLDPKDVEVPGDMSSAAFFIVAAILVEGSDLIFRGVGLNPTRDGLIRVLKRMGADIEVLDVHGDPEPAGDIRVKSSGLKGTTIEAEEIPLLIDEIPVLMIAALMAEGCTEITNISELKMKESDRVKTMRTNLSRLGVEIREERNTLFINGTCKSFTSTTLNSFGDHRIAMSMAVAALLSDKECLIRNVECVDTSYPGFLADLAKIRK